jgi:hypothetical protein
MGFGLWADWLWMMFLEEPLLAPRLAPVTEKGWKKLRYFLLGAAFMEINTVVIRRRKVGSEAGLHDF